MKWKVTQNVLGMGLFDEVINGDAVKVATVFVEEGMEHESGNCWGHRGVPFAADVEHVREWGAKFGETLPRQCVVSMEMEVGRKSEKIRVVAIEPVHPMPAGAKAA